jgi:hypothetical protein
MATRMQTGDTDRGRSAVVRRGVLEEFYAGEPVPCPVGCGGESELVRTGTRADGSGEVWFECRSCAQRRRYDVPAATRAERSEVAAELAADREPTCPRHGPREALKRRGRQLFCGMCGVVFRD